MLIAPVAQDVNFDTDISLVWKNWNRPTATPGLSFGVRVHPTRESIDYALDLLSTQECDHVKRATKILKTVVRMQEQDAREPTFGLWPRYLEDPLKVAEDPDPFWTEIIGYRLCRALWTYRHLLAPEVIEAINIAIACASESLCRRRWGVPEDRFSLIGAIVVLGGAEQTGDNAALESGRERLRQLVQNTQRSGEFGEYNSPPLTLHAIDECDVLLLGIADKAALRYAEQLRYIGWRSIAEHFHPATQQWAGPHGWNDQDLLKQRHLSDLMERPPGCPIDLRERLSRLPADEIVVRQLHVQHRNDTGSVKTTTWLSEKVCLGTADEECLWQRRRPLVAYWPGRDGDVAVLRARFLHDGHDFASALLRTVQDKNRVLCSFSVDRSGGDLHPYYDRPSNAAFRAADFRIRFQLTAIDATVEDLGDDLFVMTAGEHMAAVHAVPGFFYKTELRWTFGREGNTVFVDAICYSGESKIFRMQNIKTVLAAAGLEILPKTNELSPSPQLVRAPEQHFQLLWPELTFTFSSKPRE